MTGGRWWGTLFFLFMVFAALSTVLGVCENILAMVRELTGLSRPKGALLCGVGIFLLALTTALGYSVLHFQPFAAGTAWLDLWDFIVSNNILPLGSLVLALFCCNSFGWGLGCFCSGGQHRQRLKSAALDEADLPLCGARRHCVHLYLRHGDFCMELIPPLFINPYLSLQAVWRRSVILPASFCPIWREYQNLRLTLRFRHPDVKLLTRVYRDKHM